MESGLARFERKGSPRRRPCSASAAPAWTRVNIVIVKVWCPDPDKLETAFVLSPDPGHQEDMIPIVLGGTPVSRFWVMGGVAAMMNGYPWVVQLKLVTAELLKIMPPHSSSKATKNESSCPDEIPLQMLPMGMWGPENMKIKNI